MSKKRIREDFRVVVTPAWWGRETEERRMTECEDMAKSIRRNVDDVQQAAVVWDTRYVCSHCGYEWEEDEDGWPVCCRAAINEFEKPEATDER